MKYLLTKDFTRLEETSGTIQNASKIRTIEVSDDGTEGNGILLYPQQKHSFRDSVVYARGVDGAAEIRVVPFELDARGGDEGVEGFIIAGESYYVASNVEVSDLLDDIFGTED